MTSDIRSWLDELGLGQYAAVFIENDIEPDILSELNDQDLKELGVSLGHRKRIIKAIGGGVANPATATVASEDTAERRQLTVMFCDLVDSTRLSVQADPEDLRLIISRFQECCEQVVTSFGGSVARYMGDGLLVYFGYPAADEHDPERAVRAGLEITRAVGLIKAGSDIVLQTRVGIATGEVIVGDLIGEGRSQEHAVIGETPNLAARLQGLAQPDTVVVARTTRKLISGMFELADLGPHELKGFAEPIHAWQVARENEIQNRFEARHPDSDYTSILGREAETTKLLECWDRARQGDGQVALILGEAGIGKSRLSLALRNRVVTEPHFLVRYFCVPYHKETAFFPIASQLKRAAGIGRTDAPELKLQKIQAMVMRFSKDADKIVPLYASLLGVPLMKGFAPSGISPRLQKEQTLAAIEAQLVQLAADQPLLVVFEDLHWIDPTSLELIERLIERLGQLRMMLVVTGRPEFTPTWPESDNVISLSLDKLDEEHVLRLIDRVTDGKSLPEEVVQQILARTDGIPLFVEELTQTLLESGRLKDRGDRYVLKGSLPDLAIPETLQDSLMARLDRLGPGKKVAQIGAAIGRTFSYELISRVSSLDQDQLEEALDRLAAAGLVFCSGAPPKAEYLFKHALVQDAAYSTLLKENRRALHQKIAEALELYFPEVGQQSPEVLAQHYTRAGDLRKAIPQWETAARMAIQRAAHEEARRDLELALELLSQLPDDESRLQLELGLQTAMGLALESTRGYAAEEVENAYDRAREICEQLDKSVELVPVLLGLYVFNFVRGNFVRAGSFVDRCVELSTASRRLDYLIESYAAQGFVHGHRGQLATARDTLENCLSLYDSRAVTTRFDAITAQDPGVAAGSLLAIVLLQLGHVERAQEVMHKALEMADRLGRPINKAIAHTHATEFYALARDYTRAMEHGRSGMQISLEHGHDPWYVCSMIHTGIAASALGQIDEGVALAQQGLAMWEGGGARVNSCYFMAATAWGLHQAGQPNNAMSLLRDALAVCDESAENLHLSMLHRQMGDMLVAGVQGDEAAARDCYRQALAVAKEQAAVLPQLRAAVCLYRLDKTEQDAATLAQSIEKFPEDCRLVDVLEARAALTSRTDASMAHGLSG
jgi:class 3 adenylate cyclase/tetratricopeptide (TPR) repeat protein